LNGQFNSPVITGNSFPAVQLPSYNLKNSSLSVSISAPRNWWGVYSNIAATLGISGKADFTPALSGFAPQIEPGSVIIMQVDADGVAAPPPPSGILTKSIAQVTFAFDRLMDPATVLITAFRFGVDSEVNDISVVPLGDGRTWTVTIPNLQNDQYEVRVDKTTSSCAGVATGSVLVVKDFEVVLQNRPPKPQELLGSSPDNKTVVLTWIPPATVPAGQPYQYRLRRTGLGGGQVIIPNAQTLLSGVTYTDNPQATVGLPPDLEYSIVTVDDLGQESDPVPFGISMDNQPPQVNIVESPDPVVFGTGAFITRDTEITITANDKSGVASISYDIGNNGWTGLPIAGGTADLSKVADGLAILSVVATDNLDNPSTPAVTKSYVIDNTPPVLSLNQASSAIFSSGVKLYIAKDHSIVFDAPDAGSGLASITVNDEKKTVTAGSNSATFSGLTGGAGTLDLSVKAEDAVGNIAYLTPALNVIAGAPVSTLTTAPAASYGTAPTYVRPATTFTLSAKSGIGLPGSIAVLSYRITNPDGYTSGDLEFKGVDSATFKLSVVAPSLPPGLFTISYHAVDQVTNAEVERSDQFRLIVGKPAAPGVDPQDQVYTVGSSQYAKPPLLVLFAATVDSDLGGLPNGGFLEISYTVTGLSADPIVDAASGPLDLTLIGTGDVNASNVHVQYMVKDVVGQIAVSPIYTINLNTAPALLGLTFSPSQHTYSPSTPTYLAPDVAVGIVPTGSDVAPGTLSIEYRITREDGTVFPTDGSFATLVQNVEGLEPNVKNVLTFRIAGKSTTEQSRDLFVDAKAPNVTLTVDPTALYNEFVSASGMFTITAPDGDSGVTPATGYFLSRTEPPAGELRTFAPTKSPFSLLTDGPVSVVVRAVDNVGNAGDSTPAMNLTVDGTRPDTTLIPGPVTMTVPGQRSAASPWSFTILTTDGNGSGVVPASTHVYDHINSVATLLSPQDGLYTIQGKGTHVITYSSKDNVGNQEAEKSYSVVLLDNPPTGPRNLAAAPASSHSVLVTWAAPDPILTPAYTLQAYLVYKADAGTIPDEKLTGFTNVATVAAYASLQYTAAVDVGGSAVFVVLAQDVLGRVSPAPSSGVTGTAHVQPPVIDTPGPSDFAHPGIFSSLKVTVAGKAEPNADIYMQISGSGVPAAKITTVGGNGSFSVDVPFDSSLQGTASPLTLVFTTQMGSQISTSGVTRFILISLPPTKPTGLHVEETSDTRLHIRWDRNTGGTVASYNVYRNGNQTPLATVAQSAPGDDVEFYDLALTDGPTYTYQVQAVDMRGAVSDKSDPVSASCSAGSGWAP
jgi:hypothetical protein